MVSKKECTGCGACSSVCPHKAIQMVTETNGFFYPSINNEMCTKCGLCEKVCPVEISRVNSRPLLSFAAILKDEKVRLNSSSGGVFAALGKNSVENGGIVYGAAFDNNFKVRHISAVDIKGIENLQGSKYVQSDISETFSEIKILLVKGKSVMFVGTPCQVAGLKTFLGKEYNNLLTVDLICHGVPSPNFWKKYLEYREKEATSKAKKVFFRNKENGWKTFSMQFVFENSLEYKQILTKDLYMKGFLSNIFLRECCYNCQFKKDNYYSDLTLADFWGIDKIIPDINDNKGVSLVLVNTEKGLNEINKIANDIRLYKVNVSDALKGNVSYFYSPEPTLLNKKALIDSSKMEFDKLINKYCGMSLSKRLIRKISRIFACK